MAAARGERREAAEAAGRAGDQRLGDRSAALCRGPGEGVSAERRAARAFRPGRRRPHRNRRRGGRRDLALLRPDDRQADRARRRSRRSDRANLRSILDEVEVWPVRTNAAFLFNALLEPTFGRGRIEPGFIERKLDELVPDPEPDDALWRGAAAVAMAEDGSAGFGAWPVSRAQRFARMRTVALGRSRRIRDRSPGRRTADGSR